MVAGIGNKCVKGFFFTFNFLFFLFGGSIVAISLWIRFDNDFQTRLSEAIRQGSGQLVQLDQMYLMLYIAAGIGALLCLTGFLGCCGACCESVPVLGLFFTIVLVLFVAEIAGSIYIFVQKDTIKQQIAVWYKKNLVDEYASNLEIAKQLDQIQSQYKCCGASGCSDYSDTAQGRPPESCDCSNVTPGCSNKAFEAIAKNIVAVIVVAVGILAVELLAMVFSCILCSAIRHSDYDYY